MQLLIHLPLLPFTAAFDILFRHGGFAAFARTHGGETEEATYQFWRLFFVSSPVGKLFPARVGRWVDAMCTCFIVQSLAHPAHAVYLLRPVRHEIPESVAAWAVAGGRGNQLLRVEFLITAMVAFLPVRHYESSPPLQREWFRIEEIWMRRSARGWLRYADEVIANHFFTTHWWAQQREGPFYLLSDGECDTMGRVIVRLAQREVATLKARVAREETAKMVRELQRAKEVRAWKKSDEVKTEKMKNNEAQSKGTPHQKKHQPPAVPKRPTPTSLTVTHKQEIERLTRLRCDKQTTILAQVQSAMSSLSVSTLEDHFRRVLCWVVSLGHRHPRIKWSIKLALHEAAVETGRSVWDVERELHNVRYHRDAEPLEKLVRLADDDKTTRVSARLLYARR